MTQIASSTPDAAAHDTDAHADAMAAGAESEALKPAGLSAHADTADAIVAAATGSPTTGLHLRRLTLNGFKSFADKTTFSFDHPITGVVGPNGCGKSNLVDAVKWVLGERSSKSLRGKEMIDVIFAGSAGRKPAGMAAVTLTFENPVIEGPVDIDEPEPDETESAETLDHPEPAPADTGTAEADATEDNAAQPEGEAEPKSADDHVSDDPVSDDKLSGDDAEAARDPRHHPDLDEPGESILADRRRVRRPLPIDADEVSVERQLFRDGTSKYLINGKRARLKDIRDLFLDTGIGADAYSIIEQGKVDAMLLASPQERRTIFEEAAGIAKFKQRRIEAQRKLDRAEANLVRTREQLENTERRLRIVRGQAAKARRFKELDDECSALRLAIAFDQYDDVSQHLAGLTSQLQRLQTERDRTQHDLAECESALQDVELRHAEAAAELRRLQDDIRETEHAREGAAQRKTMAERAIDETARQLEIDTQRLDAATARLEALETDIDDQRETIAAIAERAADAERALDAASAERTRAAESIATVRHEHDKTASSLRRMERERDGLRAEADTLGHRLADLQTSRARLDDRAASVHGDRDQAQRDRAEAQARVDTRAAEIRRLEGEVADLSARGEDIAGARSERAALVDRLSEQRVGLDARRATLDDMIKSRAGLAEAARWVMDRRDAGEGFAGVVAPLAELLETDTEHAAAVEAALGADLQAVVTRTTADAPTAEETAALPGRVRFLPLRGVGPGAADAASPEDPALALLPGTRLTRVRTLVRTAPGHDEAAPLLDRLLARTYLVEDRESALMLLAGPMSSVLGVRFITRGGEVLDDAGSVDAGPAGAEQGVGLIRHAAELAEINEQLETVTAELERERGELARLSDAWAEINRTRESRSGELAEHRRAHVAEQARADRLDADLERLGREAASIAGEIERAEARREELDTARRGKLEDADGLDTEIAEQRSAVDELARRIASLQGELESSAERMSRAREEAGRANAQLDAARRELAALERAREETADSRAEHERHAAQATERHAHHLQTIEKAAAEIAACDERLAADRETLVAQQERAEATEGQRSAAAERVTQSRERARLVERDWHGVEASRRELEVKRETLEERAADDLRIDLAAEYLEYRAVMAPGDVTRVDIADSQARVNVLRGEITKLGNVNLDSIDEEGQLAEADEQLRAQLEDLDEARVRLSELIARLNDASRERFGEVFGLIRENFGGQNGMFRRLFGGGRAEVRLMGLVKEVEEADGSIRKVVTDQTDLLESGIEVIAKPPGKEPRSISQLSGGEKTLTAVALLMAIFRSKPSCFCVLDEVDAALDEANVGRFGQTVRAFTDMSSFIIITHNKRTMQLADHLYGVTQQERGVSKRVSVRFDHVKADGSFDPAAATNAHPEKPTGGSPALPAPDGVTADAPAPAVETQRKSRPSGALRRALASMRDDQAEPVRVESARLQSDGLELAPAEAARTDRRAD